MAKKDNTTLNSILEACNNVISASLIVPSAKLDKVSIKAVIKSINITGDNPVDEAYNALREHSAKRSKKFGIGNQDLNGEVKMQVRLILAVCRVVDILKDSSKPNIKKLDKAKQLEVKTEEGKPVNVTKEVTEIKDIVNKDPLAETEKGQEEPKE